MRQTHGSLQLLIGLPLCHLHGAYMIVLESFNGMRVVDLERFQSADMLLLGVLRRFGCRVRNLEYSVKMSGNEEEVTLIHRQMLRP